MKKYIFSFIVLSVSLFAFIQIEETPEFLISLKEKLNSYSEKLPEEQVYLQLDKPLYKPGDDIWFSAHVLEVASGKPTMISDVVYVELINPKGNLVEKKSLFVKRGIAPGDFMLDENAPGGLYKIRAYTTWMKNFETNKIFEKEIVVQKAIMPKLLLKLEYERENYGPGEEVQAIFEARDIEDQPISFQSFEFKVNLNGNDFYKSVATTDESGKCSFQFLLPKELNSNDGILTILMEHKGVKESISRSVPIVFNKISVSFFPEGGDMISGVENYVAFKAENEFGKPADIEGKIINDAGKEITKVSSYHMGMGKFLLKPDKGRKYYLKINSPVGLNQPFLLPASSTTGYAMQINTSEKEDVQRISFYVPNEQMVYLVGISGTTLNYSKSINASKGWNEVNIHTHEFPMGITRFTLFDTKGIERCERLVFLNKHKQLKITVTTDKPEYAPREKVRLKIEATDEDGTGIPVQVSLAVTDDQVISFADDKQDHLLSYFFLSSELKGKIEEPNFYFDQKETKADQALDLLLLTHGWRRFTWKEVRDEQFTINHLPEKSGWISGNIINSNTGNPIRADVYLFEINNQKRAVNVETNQDGAFLFINDNPTSMFYLAARPISGNARNIKINLDRKDNALLTPHTVIEKELDAGLIPEVIMEQFREEPELQGALDKAIDFDPNDAQVLMMNPDVKQLSEVVVVGYGTTQRHDITGSVTRITRDQVKIVPPDNVLSMLQGRVAGVDVNKMETVPGNRPNITVRGIGTFASNDPLYIVNGMVLEKDNLLQMLSPNQIESISVLRSPEAASIYGSRGQDGVIVINTRQHDHFIRRYPKESDYMQLYVPNRKFDRVREFHLPNYINDQIPEVRSDFRETIYWNPSVITDKDGMAEVNFYNSDATTTFRITVEGSGIHGLIGRSESTYASRLPLSIDVKIPAYLSFEDTVNIPVMIRNNTATEMKGILSTVTGTRLTTLQDQLQVEILSETAKTVYLPAVVNTISGNEEIEFTFNGGGYLEKIRKQIEVNPKGYPVEVSYSSQDLTKNISFYLNQPMNGSIKAELVAFPDIVGELMSGIESIIREPYGCFEQASSSTYPNIIALQYLKESGQNNPEVEKKALAYINQGYKKLIGYETSSKGYEWFGHTPPHEGLTAYGIMEFVEMKHVYPHVSDEMIKRTINWLMERRDGKGGFKRSSQALDGFGRASEVVNNAYIVYSLSEAKMMNIKPEYQKAMNEALQSNDHYRLALMANAAFNLGEYEEGRSALDKIKDHVKKKGFEDFKAQHSITYSQGKSLQIETASLTLMGLLKEDKPDYNMIRSGIQFLVNSRSYGGFGSTQGTILALKALTTFTKMSKTVKQDGTLHLYYNNQLISSHHYKAGDMGEIRMAGLEKYIKAGKQEFKVVFDQTDHALPYSLNLNWTSYTPNAHSNCSVALETQLSASNVKLNETVRMTIQLSNKKDEGIPMSVALVGIPSGLSLQPWQLKELQEKQVFDFYEIRGSYLVIYYRAMAPGSKKIIHLDLKAEVPGKYEAPASSAFLYYTNEFRDWVSGEKVNIRQ